MTEKKKRRRPGWALFIDRLRRDGKYKAYRKYYDANREEGQSNHSASFNACLSMGYEGPDVERKLHDEYLLKQSFLEKRELHQSELDLNADEEKQIELSRVLGEFDVSESSLPEDIAWSYHNLHKAKGEVEEWLITPEDAPSPGGWAMLVGAGDNTTKFMELVIREQMKINAQQEQDTGMKATEHSIEQIAQMISALD